MKKCIFNIIIAVILASSIYFAYMFFKILHYSDYSYYDPQSSKSTNMTQSFNNVYLVSYADGPNGFKINQRTLAISALENGVTKIFNYNRADLDEEFVNRNSYILNKQGGAGLWLWKPYVILKTLEQIPEDAIILYADSAFMFIKDIENIVSITDKHGMMLVYYDDISLYGKLGKKVNRNILEKTNCDTIECRNAPSIWAAFGGFKNTASTREFVKKWLELCEQKELITGEKFGKQQYPEYTGHQFDESLLCVTNFLNNNGQHLMPASTFHKHVLWHHRKINDPSYQYSILPSILKSKKILRGFQRNLYNSKFMAWARRKLFPTS